MKKIILSMAFYCGCSMAFSMVEQTVDSSPPQSSKLLTVIKKVNIYGFTRFDAFYNTRRNADLRDGVLQLYPLDASNLPTKNGNTLVTNPNEDINATGQLGFSAIVTRFGFKISDIYLGKGKVTGNIETDFVGISNGPAGSTGAGTENLIRLRHAYVAIDWPKVSLLAGQYWVPGFLPNNYPGVANFLTGIPYNPFGFVPQIRITYKFTKTLSLMGMIFHYASASFSPAGRFVNNFSGVDIAKFSKVPSFYSQITYSNANVLIGLGAEVSTLRPNIQDGFNPLTQQWTSAKGDSIIQKNMTTNLVVGNLLFFTKFTFPQLLTLKTYTLLGQNVTPYVSVGGFAQYRDMANANRLNYRPLNQLNVWGELIYTGHKSVQPAVFVGYIKNYGLNRPINATKASDITFLGRGINDVRTFDHIIKIAPRCDIYFKSLKIALEYEWNRMLFGDADRDSGISGNYSYRIHQNRLNRTFFATNHRVLLIVVYNF